MTFLKNKLFIFLPIVTLLVLGSLFFPKTPASAQANTDCTVTSATFSPGSNAIIPHFYNPTHPPTVLVAIITNNCIGKPISVSLVGVGHVLDATVPEYKDQPFTVSSKQLLISLTAGDTFCGSGTSDPADIAIKVSTPDTTYKSDGELDGELKYNCSTYGKHPWQFISSAQSDTLPAQDAGDCSVTSATFDPYSQQPDGYAQHFYLDNHHPGVTISLQTQNCGGKKIFVNLVEAGSSNAVHPVGVDPLDNKEYTVPTSNQFTINLGSGETKCYKIDSPDCKYFIIAGPQEYNFWNFTFNSNLYFYSKDKTQGMLAYDCDGLACYDSWKYVSDTSNQSTPNSTNLQNDPNATANGCTGQCYTLFSGFAQALGNKFKGISSATSLGGWLNAIIAFIIGIGTILAVAMIMYEGFKYMTAKQEGNVLGVGSASSSIWKIILGLLLMLSVYTLLKTINPDLLNLTPTVQQVNIPSTSDNSNPTDQVSAQPSNIPSSGQGFTMVGTYINPTPNTASTNFAKAAQELQAGATITKIAVKTAGGSQTSGTISFTLSTGTVATSPISTGHNGVAEAGQGVSGDGKTPKGSYTIGTQLYVAKNQQNAVIASNYNYGAAFLVLNITTPNGSLREIGIHGKANDSLGTTNGCIRMYNDELVMIAHYVTSGIPITIS